MRKSISVTNSNVIDTLNNALNASELVEIAVLYYLGEITKEYVETYRMLQDTTKELKKGRSEMSEDGEHH